jgi:hypothetical protein
MNTKNLNDNQVDELKTILKNKALYLVNNKDNGVREICFGNELNETEISLISLSLSNITFGVQKMSGIFCTQITEREYKIFERYGVKQNKLDK